LFHDEDDEEDWDEGRDEEDLEFIAPEDETRNNMTMRFRLKRKASTIELESRPKKKISPFMEISTISVKLSVIYTIKRTKRMNGPRIHGKDLSTSNSKKNLILWEEGF
jgi:hypothetical protein